MTAGTVTLPKDAASTRSNILAAAVQTLQRGGIEGFTLDAVARRAGVVKGLILYHYASRGRLLRSDRGSGDRKSTRLNSSH